VNDENGDLLADSRNVLNRWKNYISQLLNVHNVSDVRQIGVHVHTVEPLVPGPSRLEVEIAVAKLKKYKSPGSDQIPAELIQAGGEMFAIHKLIKSIWNKEELPDQWKESVIVPVHRKGETLTRNYHRTSLLSTSYAIFMEYALKVKLFVFISLFST
jgi:hypothetical protein